MTALIAAQTPLSEPLLTANTSRYVMFPIVDHDIWSMYKKQVECFWRVEEVDLSKDLEIFGRIFGIMGL